MKLLLDISTEEQKQNIINLAHQLNISVEILDITEAEDDAALIRAIEANAKNDLLSSEETAEFINHLGK